MFINGLLCLLSKAFFLKKRCHDSIAFCFHAKAAPASVIFLFVLHILQVTFCLVCHRLLDNHFFSVLLFNRGSNGEMTIAVGAHLRIKHFFISTDLISAHLDQKRIGKIIHSAILLNRLRHLSLPEQCHAVLGKVPGRQTIFLLF